MRPARDSWVNPLLALAFCATAGALFRVLHVPLPWMLGPLLAMAAGNFAGARLRAVPGGRSVGQIVIGTALGLYFTPVVARQVASFWPLLIFAGVFAILLGVFSGWVLSRLGQTDARTAFFASVPGGAAEMTILGERYGARPDRVALAQSLRILIVVMVIPFALTYSGVHGTDAYAPAATPVAYPGLATLLGLATIAGVILARTGMPNAFMFGPLALVVVLTANEVQFSSIPGPISNAAQVLIGCALGERFERRSLASAPRYVGATLASVLAAIGCSMAFAALLGWASRVPVASLVLATAPGGIAEMCITAKVLQLGVPLVTAAHVTRVIVLITTTGPSYRFARLCMNRFRRRNTL
ncbi:MAG TPA: AbrB family transcriptional regulator [Burkholderiales bacterium]|nr:AbrB family transcriptional regulator [Burkholderiales bacterium]